MELEDCPGCANGGEGINPVIYSRRPNILSEVPFGAAMEWSSLQTPPLDDNTGRDVSYLEFNMALIQALNQSTTASRINP
jgi:hypothetical protein